MAKKSLPKWNWLPDITPPPSEPRKVRNGISLKPDASAIRRVVASSQPKFMPVVSKLITEVRMPLDGNFEDDDLSGSDTTVSPPATATAVPPARPKKAVTIGKIGDAKKFLFLDKPPTIPPLVVEGLLHRGSIMSIGGASKSHKSFSLLELALQVSTGNDFWGLKTCKGRVLYVNLELQEFEIYKRLIDILTTRGISLGKKEFGIWNLRGYTPEIETIAKEISDIYGIHNGKPDQELSLIIIDPIYKCYGGRDENNASDVASLFAVLEGLAMDTNAAVVFAAHFAKGNSNEKAVIDRISGSGVYGRYPDSIMTITDIKGHPDYYDAETVLRNFNSIDPFCLEWDYPVMSVCKTRPTGPAATSPVPLTGRAPKHSMADLVALLSAKPMTRADWSIAASGPAMGVNRSTFKRYAREAIAKGLVKEISKTDPRLYDVSKGIPVPTSTKLSTPALKGSFESEIELE